MVILTQDILRKYIRGVFQAGIGAGGDESVWWEAGIHNQIYVEPYEPWYNNLINRVTPRMGVDNIKCFNVALSNVNETTPFHICNQGDSHSLLPLSDKRDEQFKWMQMESTTMVSSRTLDSLVEEHNINMSDFNLLHLDTQCSEHLIIDGAKKNLHFFDIVVIEICRVEVYEGVKLFDDWAPFMAERGFRVKFVHDFEPLGATDTVFVRVGSPWDKEG